MTCCRLAREPLALLLWLGASAAQAARPCPELWAALKHAGREEAHLMEVYKMPESVTALDEPAWRELALMKLGSGSNEGFLAVDSQGRKVAVVKLFRSDLEQGIFPWTHEIEAGGLARREVFAANLDARLGYGLVPRTTVGRASDGSLTTMQSFKHGKPLHAADLSRISDSEIQKQKLFDLLLGQYDRHENNYLVGDGGRLWLIDNGGSLTRDGHSARARPAGDWQALAAPPGPVDAQVARPVLELSPADYESLLEAHGIPPRYRQVALRRLAQMQTLLRAEVPLDEMIDILRPRNTSARSFRRTLGTAAGLAGAGYGAYVFVADE